LLRAKPSLGILEPILFTNAESEICVHVSIFSTLILGLYLGFRFYLKDISILINALINDGICRVGILATHLLFTG
jgi:hypothetical protein